MLNNGCGLLPIVALVALYDEPAQWRRVLNSMGGGAWALVGLSCINGVAISYAGLRVQQLVTATSFMVLTNVNKFIVILFGALVLHEPLTPLAALGMLLAIGGGLAYAKVRQQIAEVQPAPPPGPPPDEDDEEAALLRKR